MSEYIRTNKFSTNKCTNIFEKEKLIQINIRINICVTPNFNWMAEQKEEEKNYFTPIGPNEYFVLVCSYKLEHCCISCGWQMLAELFFTFSQLSKWIEPHFSEQQASNIRKALLAPPRGADKNLLAPQLFSSMWSPGPEDGDDIPQLASVFLLPDFLARNISNLNLSLFNVRAFLCFDLRGFLGSKEMDWFPIFRSRQKSKSLAINCLANSKQDFHRSGSWVSLRPLFSLS